MSTNLAGFRMGSSWGPRSWQLLVACLTLNGSSPSRQLWTPDLVFVPHGGEFHCDLLLLPERQLAEQAVWDPPSATTFLDCPRQQMADQSLHGQPLLQTSQEAPHLCVEINSSAAIEASGCM